MIREQERYFSPIIYLSDCVGIVISYALCAHLYMKALEIGPPVNGSWFSPVFAFHWDRYLLGLPFFFVAFLFFYHFWYRHRAMQLNMLKTMMVQAAIPCLLTGVVFLAFAIINQSLREDFWFVLTFISIDWVFLVANRMFVLLYLRREQKKGRYIRYLLMVGTGECTRNAALLFDNNPGWGINVIGFLTNNKDEVGMEVEQYKVIGLVDDLLKVLENTVVDVIFSTSGTASAAQIQDLVNRCELMGIDLILDVSTLLAKTIGVSLEPLGGMSTVLFRPLPYSPEKLFLKRLLDLVISGSLIALCIPLWIVLPLFIKRDSPGPAFYVQERVGKHGRRFRAYKFRTMVANADSMREEIAPLNEMDGPALKVREDSRLTKAGKFLRKLRLDELPQLLNVFLGDMSLVGPRPPTMEEVLKYQPWQRKRLSVMGGVTCLWRVAGRKGMKFDEWMKLDLQYIENWSFTLDLKILFMTVVAVILRRDWHSSEKNNGEAMSFFERASDVTE